MRLALPTRGAPARRVFARAGWFRRLRVAAKIRLARYVNMRSHTKAARGLLALPGKAVATLLAFFRRVPRVTGALFVTALDAAAALRDPLVAAREAAGGIWLIAREKLHKLNARTPNRISAVAMLTCLTVLIASSSYYGVALEVKVDGHSLGFVNSTPEIEAIITEVEERTAAYLGRPYSINVNIAYSLGYYDAGKAFNADEFRDYLFATVNGMSTQYVLTVDGEVIGANASRTALESLKQRILDARAGRVNGVRTEFAQEVRIEERPVSNAEIRPIAEIEAALSANKQEVMIYSVQEHDTVTKIANRFGLTISQIQELNPDLNISRINIGDPIKISGAVPVLSIKQTRQEKYVEPVPYETMIEETDTLYKNQSRVIQNGVPGSASVVADVVYVDGVEAERVVLEYTVNEQPTVQIKQVGTKEPPPKSAKGYFILPYNGVRTSLYGWRSRGFHTGLDLAGPSGSPIVASDGGTVIYAALKGTYGLCVIIDHGNGYKTLYAHCSKLLVAQGQKVAQGELIARVGSTGNSTGPHVHFEIIVNGKTVNPLNYIR